MPSVSRQSDEHDEHDDIPNPTPEQRHNTSEDEVVVDDHQEQTPADSDDAHDSEVINNIRYSSFINHYCFTIILKIYLFSFVIVEDKAV